MTKSNNNVELKNGYIYSFYYDSSPEHVFYSIFKNGKLKVLLYEDFPVMYALFTIGETCFSGTDKPNLKEIGKINSRIKIILTLGFCGFVDRGNEGVLKKAFRYFYKRTSA